MGGRDDLSDLSDASSASAGGPVLPSSDRSRGLVVFAASILVTVGLVTALVALWPEGDGSTAGTEPVTTTTSGAADSSTTTAPGAQGEPTETTREPDPTGPPTNLFVSGADAVLTDLRRAAGDADQAIEITIYDTYAFLAYRDPAAPGNIDRRLWRDGRVGDAEPNVIDDRVDADTEPELFDLDEVDLTVLPSLAADAPTQYDVEVEVTHVIIDRFLPFDERVLIRVYTRPTDGRSGGGYVSYDTAGTLVRVCC